jgi:hypothetical protein
VCKLYGCIKEKHGPATRFYAKFDSTYDAVEWAKSQRLTIAHIFEDGSDEIIQYEGGEAVYWEVKPCGTTELPEPQSPVCSSCL